MVMANLEKDFVELVTNIRYNIVVGRNGGVVSQETKIHHHKKYTSTLSSPFWHPPLPLRSRSFSLGTANTEGT